jgi:TatD DNase family protein
MSTIAYPLKNAVYLNITNRCNNRCDFCIKFLAKKFHGQYDLWLDREPTVEEIILSVDSVIAGFTQVNAEISKSEEIVFCGYGESLIRLDVVKEVSKILKSKGVKIRIDTDGLANWNFIKEAKKYIPKVIASVVELPEIDIGKCRKIAKDLGVEFLVRKYYEEKYPI